MIEARHSYYEANARGRVAGLVDAGSFAEILPPAARLTSPHLAVLELPVAFDDGVIIGRARLAGQPVLVAAQEGGFNGGAVGEVHGAKIVGLLRLALRERPAGVVLLVDSGGVRLHEANAGLIAVSEIMRAVLDARAAGVPVLAIVGGQCGCFGGMGIVARCCDAVVMNEEGRLSLSGPEVIETVCGAEEFDSRDRPLVWRITGGKSRYLLGEADCLVADDFAAFRAAAIELLAPRPVDLDALEAEHARLARRLERFGACRDMTEIWKTLGMNDAERLPLLEAEDYVHAVCAPRQGVM